MSKEIYTRLLDYCQNITLNPRWQFAAADPNCLTIEGEMSQVLPSLQSEFSEQDLVQAGILLRRDDHIGLNPILARPGRTLIVLRDSDGQAFDVVTGAYTLRRKMSIFAIRDEAATQRALAATDSRLFVTSSIKDTVLLRSLGLAAAPPLHLDRLQGPNLHKLLSMADGFSERRDYFHMVLVGCNLTAGTSAISPKVIAVTKHFADAKRYLRKSRLAVSVWDPSEEEKQDLEYRRRAGCADLVRKFFKQARLLNDIETFSDRTQSSWRTPDFASALMNLLQVHAKSRKNVCGLYSDSELREARDEFERQVDRTVFRPLLERGVSSDNPSLRVLRLQLAQVSRVMLRAMTSVHNAQDIQAEIDGDQMDFVSDASLDRIRMLTEMAVKLIREETLLRKNLLG